MGGQNVDVILVGAHVGILRGHRFETFIPKRHRDGDAVGLGGRRQVFLRPAARQLERVAKNAVHAVAREHDLLHCNLVVAASVEAAADLGVFALVVFADDVEIDVARVAVAQRRFDAGHEPHWPDVRILAKFAADRNEQSPERDVIGHSGKSHRSQINRVVMANLREAVLGHHATGLLVVNAAPGKVIPREAEAVLLCGRVEDEHAWGDHFLADAVTGDGRDAIIFHRKGFNMTSEPFLFNRSGTSLAEAGQACHQRNRLNDGRGFHSASKKQPRQLGPARDAQFAVDRAELKIDGPR